MKRKWTLGMGYVDPEMDERSDGEYSGPKYADLGIYKDGELVLPLRIDHHQIMLDLDNGEDVKRLKEVLGELVAIANKSSPCPAAKPS